MERMSQKDRAKIILTRLKKSYKKAGPFAKWKNPLELTVATMLSAQCTDARVNQVTQDLFKRYRTVRAYAIAPLKDLEKAVYRAGYYRSKAKYLKGIGRILEKKYDGKVPKTFEDLMRLPGISKKSACIIAAKAFQRYYGVAVDTHVFRVAPRLGLTKSASRDGIAKDLEKFFPPHEYLNVNEFFITHGRAVCSPRVPKCGECILQDICPTGKKVTKEQVTKQQGKNYEQSRRWV